MNKAVDIMYIVRFKSLLGPVVLLQALTFS